MEHAGATTPPSELESNPFYLVCSGNNGVYGPIGRSQPFLRRLHDLLGRDGREAILEHAGSDYRLRITANGKLILTK